MPPFQYADFVGMSKEPLKVKATVSRVEFNAYLATINYFAYITIKAPGLSGKEKWDTGYEFIIGKRRLADAA